VNPFRCGHLHLDLSRSLSRHGVFSRAPPARYRSVGPPQRLADANGGRVWAESREGQGSTFVRALPLAGIESER
jgi:hypothetical protein